MEAVPLGTDQFLNPDLILGLFFSAMRRIIIPPYFFLRKMKKADI